MQLTDRETIRPLRETADVVPSLPFGRGSSGCPPEDATRKMQVAAGYECRHGIAAQAQVAAGHPASGGAQVGWSAGAGPAEAADVAPRWLVVATREHQESP